MSAGRAQRASVLGPVIACRMVTRVLIRGLDEQDRQALDRFGVLGAFQSQGMIMTARSIFWAFGLAVALGTLACGGSTLPTQQLVSARRAYGEAKATPGAHLTPDGLANAEQALDAAER